MSYGNNSSKHTIKQLGRGAYLLNQSLSNNIICKTYMTQRNGKSAFDLNLASNPQMLISNILWNLNIQFIYSK